MQQAHEDHGRTLVTGDLELALFEFFFIGPADISLREWDTGGGTVLEGEVVHHDQGLDVHVEGGILPFFRIERPNLSVVVV